MFEGKLKGSTRAKNTDLTNVWTRELIEAAIGIDAVGASTVKHREYPVVDHKIRLSGFGITVNKFDVRRMFWGWITLRTTPIPAYGRFSIVEQETEARLDFVVERSTKRPVACQRRESNGAYDGLTSDLSMPRHVVGTGSLSGRGHILEGLDRHSSISQLPVFEFALKLTRTEWEPIRECLEMARWREGRFVDFNVRFEFPEIIDVAALMREPGCRSFPITRFWAESLVSLGSDLDDHPVLLAAIATGGLEQLG